MQCLKVAFNNNKINNNKNKNCFLKIAYEHLSKCRLKSQNAFEGQKISQTREITCITN